MGTKIKLKAKQIIKQLQTSRGNVYHASQQLGVSRAWLFNYINEHPTAKQALHDIRESTKDIAESSLQQRMMSSDTLLIFYLKTQAHDRNYGQKQDIKLSGDADNPIEFIVTNESKDKPTDPTS